MESLSALRGLVLLRDSVEWEGRSLLKALIKKSALCGEQVHILGCEVSEEEFREGFDSSINSQLVYHDFFRDPLNWSKTGKALPGGPLGALRAVCGKTDLGPVTIALDSLSWLLLHLPCTTLCQTLHALSHQHSHHGPHPNAPFLPYIFCPSPGDSTPVQHVHVLGLLHEELHGPGPLGALSSLAQAEMTLSGTVGQASAHILYRRPQQRPTHETLWYSILPDFSLDLQRGSSLESQPYPDLHTPPVSKRARARTTGWSLGSGERKERKTADVGVSSDSRLYCTLGQARLPATSSMSQMLVMAWTKKTQMTT
ncbi:elongator complex protein 5 isoform X3 [Manis javanica]|uniref:elongator complex protein 5 isoform X3 n=1 Tax=Manis javanica TaxID=9974 RepID=UPI0008134F4B|nr:elongator complex protein 5 isoform X3 [Manis javanica]